MAYGRLPPEPRRELHARIGDALERLRAGRGPEPVDRLAQHALGAERWDAAVRYLRRAAATALARSAQRETLALVDQALAASAHLPEGADRWHRELTLQITRGVALIGMHGYSAPGVEEAYERARALCQRVGQTPRLLGVLLGLWAFHLFRGRMTLARELADQCLAVVAPAIAGSRSWAYLTAGVSTFWLGDLPRARDEMERALALYDVEEQGPLVAVYGQDCGVTCLAYLAGVLAAVGEHERAVAHVHEAIALAERVAHPYSIAAARSMAAAIHQLCRHPVKARPHAEAAVALASEKGFPTWRAMATLLQGWAMSETGQLDEGIAMMRRGVAGWRSLGSELAAPWFLTLTAEALGKRGSLDDALATVGEALTLMAALNDRWYEPETSRVHGALLVRQGRVAEGEAALRRAVSVARDRGAATFELRAVLTLARILSEKGDRAEARRLVAAACSGLAVPADAPDAVDARALLAELA